ncbi:MAG: gamma-glutamyltransferase [Planctomycetota bacterium]
MSRVPARAADPAPIEARHGMVVAAEPLAAAAGVAMLERGGNAIDAAVATGFALAVTYPVAGNLGGGGFLVAHLNLPDGAATRVALDFRETAPAAAHSKMYDEAVDAGRERPATVGHLAVAVPGSVRGLLDALERWGTLDRATVLAPAVELAEQGFVVPRRTAQFLAQDSVSRDMLRYAETARIFYPEGKPLSEGARLRQPELAQTLRAIVEHGHAGFYDGPVAAAIVDELQRGGGIVTREDLRAYRSIERSPLRFTVRGHSVITMPLPSSGGTCLRQMLGILERYPLSDLGHNSSASLHLIAEAMRRSFADRNTALGDSADPAVQKRISELLSAAHIERLASSIDPQSATPSAKLLESMAHDDRESEQTTHYSVVDRHRNAVAVTTTLNGAFGSKVVVTGAGFLLNNEMDDFTAHPGRPNLYGLVQGQANAVAPGRRPLSSMTPTIVLDPSGHLLYVLGSPGGPTIINNVLQVLLNLMVYGLQPQAAVNAPKIHHQCIPDRIDHEREFPADVLDGLRRRGHALRLRDSIGDFQAICVDSERGLLLGASDPRGGGAARGY